MNLAERNYRELCRMLEMPYGLILVVGPTGSGKTTTLHTNSAPETVTRLLGMKVDPFNFSDSLLGILAQRLVRRLCPQCREAYAPTQEEQDLLVAEYGPHPLFPLTEQDFAQATLFRPKGCGKCRESGYVGRIAIHELMTATDELKSMIAKNSPISEIRNEAMRGGMTTLKQDGIRKVFQGVTDLHQIRAACIK